MVKIKICGIKCNYDITYLNKYKPDYAGFVFAESKRKVSFQEAESLSVGLDDAIKKVGVFVNMPLKSLLKAQKACRLDAVQLHGDEQLEYIEQLRQEMEKGIEIWKAIRLKNESSLCELTALRFDRLVADAYVKDALGGTGVKCDWELARAAKKYGCVILAGGLNADNICKAIEQVHPYGVDVSSGVEIDGRKDEARIREFITKVRSLEV